MALLDYGEKVLTPKRVAAAMLVDEQTLAKTYRHRKAIPPRQRRLLIQELELARSLPVLAPEAGCVIEPGTVCVLHDIAKKGLSLSDVQRILEAIAADPNLLKALVTYVKLYAQ